LIIKEGLREDILPAPNGWDEQRTIIVRHTASDVDRHLAALDHVAPRAKHHDRDASLMSVRAANSKRTQ